MDKVKILYVDDEILNLQLFEINLEEQYHILIADNALKGYEILSEHKDIRIVFSDMKMPQTNGIEFIKIAKEKYPNIKYYILTGYGINAEIREALDTGLILKYFSKPFDMVEIVKEIENIIK